MTAHMTISARLASTLAVATLAAGCGHDAGEARYPARYQRALETTAPAPVPTDATRRFVEFFETLDRDGVTARVDALYASPVYFSDTLFVTEDRAALARHFERLHARGVRIAVDLDDAVVSGGDLYLRWRMRFGTADDPDASRTIGMTQLRFDDSGRIRLHQDFWDSSEGVYRRIALLGPMIRFVERRIAAEP